MKRRRHHKPVHLTSVLNLQQQIKNLQHRGSCNDTFICLSFHSIVGWAELTELFRNHKFVGCVDQTRSLVQYSVSGT